MTNISQQQQRKIQCAARYFNVSRPLTMPHTLNIEFVHEIHRNSDRTLANRTENNKQIIILLSLFLSLASTYIRSVLELLLFQLLSHEAGKITKQNIIGQINF